MTKRPLRIVFMGTPEFSVPALDALVRAGHDVCAVYSQPPRPAGRGHKICPSPVDLRARELGIPVFTPKNLNGLEDQEIFKRHGADVAVVVAYGLILKKPILEIPPMGCINIHASLLPRWRGAAPIQRAILAGDTETGITIMQMDEGLDTGPMLARESVLLSAPVTCPELHDVLAGLGARMIVRVLGDLRECDLVPVPQSDKGMTYASRLERREGLMDWRKTAVYLERQVRAFDPWPGAFFVHKGETFKVLKAEYVPVGRTEPGLVLDSHLTIGCGEDALRPLVIQRSGKGPIPVDDFLRGASFPAGIYLELPGDQA